MKNECAEGREIQNLISNWCFLCESYGFYSLYE